MQFTEFRGKKLPHLGMGAMRLPQIGEGWGKPVDDPPAKEIIDICMAAGVNYFDTAYVYHGGDSECFLARALAAYPRDSYYLADKYNILAQPDYRIQFEEQLERLNTDYIDFYMCHGISDNHGPGYLGNGCVDYFLEEKARGRIHNLGFSFHGHPDVLRDALEKYPWDFVMFQLNYYDYFHSNMSELYEILRERDILTMAMEPVHGGMLAKLTDDGEKILRTARPDAATASWAFNFVMGLPHVKVILSGMSTAEQARQNIATFNKRELLSEDELKKLREASTLLYHATAAPCTFCRYCTGCPQDIPIPDVLNIYNDYKAGGEWRLKRLTALPESLRPRACTACGICVTECPQQLPIPDYMKEMAAY
jgi:predicted aldo/keto reductase-like oxidoreductase